jgi:hypothetical protein
MVKVVPAPQTCAITYRYGYGIVIWKKVAKAYNIGHPEFMYCQWFLLKSGPLQTRYVPMPINQIF